MNKAGRHTAAAAGAVMLCSATPCLAQDDMRFAHRSDQPMAAFAGVNLRLQLGPRGRPVPVARLAIGPVRASGGSGELPIKRGGAAAGFELGLTRRGAAELYVGGESTQRVKERLRASDLGLSPAAIAFGVVLVGVGVLVITNLDSIGDAEPADRR